MDVKHLCSRFLVTTAIEKTWPKDPSSRVLFLGEWCRLYSQKEHWSKMNAEVLPYHWDEALLYIKDNDIDHRQMIKPVHKAEY